MRKIFLRLSRRSMISQSSRRLMDGSKPTWNRSAVIIINWIRRNFSNKIKQERNPLSRLIRNDCNLELELTILKSDLTVTWDELTWDEMTIEQSDRKPRLSHRSEFQFQFRKEVICKCGIKMHSNRGHKVNSLQETNTHWQTTCPNVILTILLHTKRLWYKPWLEDHKWFVIQTTGWRTKSSYHLTLKMASARVFETSVTNSSPSQDSSHLYDRFQSKNSLHT